MNPEIETRLQYISSAARMTASVRQLHGSVGIYFNKILGTGTYGKVCRSRCGQLFCAAKILNETLFQFEEWENDDLAKFEEECQFFSSIKHPNIVQHIGTIEHPKTKRPILIMEMLDESLNSFLRKSIDVLPYHLQVNICHDVALALAYLHFNGIVHGNLSSNNVLLVGGGSRAKVSDFGMHKLVNISPSKSPLIRCNATLPYMPPEAFETPPNYRCKMDCFSYGVLTIEIITRISPRMGIENRQRDIDEIHSDSLPLLPLAWDCLKDTPKERPLSDTICDVLVTLKKESKYTHSMEKQRDKMIQKEKELTLKLKAKEKKLNDCQLQLQNKIEKHSQESEILTRKLEASERRSEDYRLKLEKKEDRERDMRQKLCNKCETIIAKNDDKEMEILVEIDNDKEMQSSQDPIKVKPVVLDEIQCSDEQVENESHDFTVPLKWRSGEPAPETMTTLYGEAVVCGDTAYISRHYNIYSYRLPENEWSKLKQSQYQSFGLTVIDDQVTTVGGISRDQKRTKCLFSLKQRTSWEESYPPMPTHRVCPAVLTMPSHLIVAGGRNKTELCTIEVMSRETEEWSIANCLPEPVGSPQISLCNGDLFVSKHQTVYSSSVKELLHSSSTKHINGTITENVWTKIADVPTYNGLSLTALGGRVLAIGGEDAKENVTGAIHCYDKVTNTWSLLGEMLTARADSLAVVFPGNKLVVVGGWSESDVYTISEIGE